MTLAEHVFLYCERGGSDALLAEPVNAASNAGFLLAALVGLVLVLRRPKYEQSADHFLLIALVLLIGIGSLSFHLYANRLTELADVVPIGVFMLVYLGYALNRLLYVPPGWTVLILIGFAAIVSLALQVRCWPGGVGFPGADVSGATQCINGSVSYLPALFAMVIIGLLLKEREHRAAAYVLWAAAIFAVSITLRSLDLTLCDRITWQGRNLGTHAAWHLLNALMLFLLIRASLEAGPLRYGRPIVILDEIAPARRKAAAERVPVQAEAKQGPLAAASTPVEIMPAKPKPGDAERAGNKPVGGEGSSGETPEAEAVETWPGVEEIEAEPAEDNVEAEEPTLAEPVETPKPFPR